MERYIWQSYIPYSVLRLEYWLYLQAREFPERDKRTMSRRGYVPEDEKQFNGKQLELLKKAADEVQFLLDRGYDVKPVTTFIGNHYLFSERQRLALARSVSAEKWIQRLYRKYTFMYIKARNIGIGGKMIALLAFVNTQLARFVFKLFNVTADVFTDLFCKI